MPRRDMWGDCYAGEHQQRLSPEEFKRFFCHLCRNPECVNSAMGSSQWVGRIETQVDRLLNNPLIADKDDPKYAALRQVNFEDAIREAMALEISSRKGDWEIPTEAAAMDLATEMTAKMPDGFQAPEPEEPLESDDDGEPEVEILWEGEAKGSKKGASYTVTLARVGDADPTWSCTCPAAKYGTAASGGCKHVLLAMNALEQQREGVDVEEEKVVPEVPTREAPVIPPQGVDPLHWKQMQDRNRVPKSPNTVVPTGGVMIGNGTSTPAEPEDSWATPASPEPVGEVVSIGGKVTMGGNPKGSTPK